ncbi:hypothetical protein [Flavobacterium sp. H122]|uniref:hypothetical protein n=1 Tax=Flavobacterium sp. H122 TaxID=2529860 RepID=UPI0010AA57D0|nr:hypothetical protein [Flavobacterium sp. H122]
MKKRPNHINLLVIFTLNLLSCINAFGAIPSPPQPKKAPPPGIPIDSNIWILVIIGLLTAFYIFRKQQLLHKK